MLKNIMIFIAGMVTMLTLIVLFGIIVNYSNNSGYPGLTLFEKDGKCVNARQLVIMQTLEHDVALAHAKTQPNTIYDPNEILVLLLGDETSHYYDDEKINVPKGKCTKQVGTYRYESRELGMKTVPAVTIK